MGLSLSILLAAYADLMVIQKSCAIRNQRRYLPPIANAPSNLFEGVVAHLEKVTVGLKLNEAEDVTSLFCQMECFAPNRTIRRRRERVAQAPRVHSFELIRLKMHQSWARTIWDATWFSPPTMLPSNPSQPIARRTPVALPITGLMHTIYTATFDPLRP